MANNYNVSVPIPVMETLLRDALVMQIRLPELMKSIETAARIMTGVYGDSPEGKALADELAENVAGYREMFRDMLANWPTDAAHESFLTLASDAQDLFDKLDPSGGKPGAK